MCRLLMVFLLILFMPTAVLAEEQSRSISTQGEAVVYIVPNEVVISFGVETVDKSLDQARKTNDEASSRLLKAVKLLGIEDKYIQADRMHVEIQYDRSNRTFEDSRLIAAYMTRRFYNVTLKDIKKFEKLVDTVLKNGANQLTGFTLQSSELRQHRDRARLMAIKAANEKAVALSAALNCKLGRPRVISEGSVGYSYKGFNFNSSSQNATQMDGDSMNVENGTLPLGQIAVRASVSVTFDLIAP